MNDRILSIDIGGSKIKASVLDNSGKLLTDYVKVITPKPATPDAVINAIKELVKDFQFNKISVGFPGYVRNGIVSTAPNLGTDSWKGTNLADKISSALGYPARVGNDADVLGLGIIEGKGLEMVITLGTGFGTALYLDGKLLPHLEIAHHPIAKGLTYDEYIGNLAYEKRGKAKWNKRLQKILAILKIVFNYDTLYIGGGNSRLINFPLEPNMKIVTNLDGIDGGEKLWDQ